MWKIILDIVLYIIIGYIVIGHVMSWKWLFEARIKCIDLNDSVWDEYLNSLQGVFSFLLLGTLLWLPVKASIYSDRKRVKTNKMSWMQSFYKVFVLWEELQLRRKENDL